MVELPAASASAAVILISVACGAVAAWFTGELVHVSE